VRVGHGACARRGRRVPVRGRAKVAYEAIEAMLQAVLDWQDKVDVLATTGDDDDEIIATHDSRGRLIELWVRPGLPRELTMAELEDRINEAITDNVGRAQAQMKRISDEFVAQFSAIPQQFAQHPVGAQLADAYAAAVRVNGRKATVMADAAAEGTGAEIVHAACRSLSVCCC
jgi:hypothetical protein